MGPQHNEPTTLFSEQPSDAPEETEQEAAAPLQSPMSFGLLFQTPDLQVRAPRREARPAPDHTPHDGEGAGSDDDAEDSPNGAESPQDSEDSEDAADDGAGNRSRRRGGRGRRNRAGQDSERDDTSADDGASAESSTTADDDSDDEDAADESGPRRRTRRRRRTAGTAEGDDPPGTVTKVREPRQDRDEVTAIKGSTRLEAKKQRRREGREQGRRRTVITEAEFLARRESVDRVMVVRERGGRIQIGVMEDGVLAEHYVSRESQQSSMAGNVYLGRVQNVLPSMEAAFVDIGRGRNAVLYAGEVNWDAAGLDNQPKRIEHALKAGESVLVQVTKDPIGHKGARLTSQISLPGRFLVYVPGNSMTGISRKLPDNERARLKRILKEIVPAEAGVIVRTAAEGASEEDLRADIERLQATWEQIQKANKNKNAPALLHGEPDLMLRVIRDVFNEDFSKLIVSGDDAWAEVSEYITTIAPDLAERLEKWTGETDVFSVHRIDEQLSKALDRKVWLPSGGSLIIDRTEAMTVIDVNTGKFVGSGGNLEETVTRNNLEAAEEIVRQLRLRDIGGIIVVDFIDMVLESNRDLVVRRLLECLGRDRTKHQVAEVTSLGLVQMTRKRVGSGLLEIFSEDCVHCAGRGVIVHDMPVEKSSGGGSSNNSGNGGSSSPRRAKKGRRGEDPVSEPAPAQSGPTAAQIAAAAHAAASKKPAVETAVETVDTTTGEPSAESAATKPHPQTPDAESTPKAATPEPQAPAEPAAEEPAKPVRRRGSRRAGSPSVAPAKAPEPAAVPVTVAAAEAPDANESVAVQPAAPAPPVKRRPKRARVVSPAGPPVNLEQDQTDR